MKKACIVLLLLPLTFVLFKCQKELSTSNIFQPQAGQVVPITASLQGNIVNENDQPVEGAMIKVGTKTAGTDARGYFRIADAPLDKNASLVTAEMTGYLTAYRTFMATSGVNQIVIKLIRKNLGGSVDATSGGTIALSNGTSVALPANGIINSSGNAYSGKVNVYAAYIDPTASDIMKIMPGSFMADNAYNNKVSLSSYGMLAVNLESPGGEKLQIANGSTATLTIPVPQAIATSAPASISLWYLDEQTGIWKEEGAAQKSGANYVGQAKHFTYWNCDIQLPSVTFSATFKTAGGALLKSTEIVIRPAGNQYTGCAHGFTDSLGQTSGLIPANMDLVMEVHNGCNGVAWSKNIGPFATNVDLGTITVADNTTSVVTVSGNLVDCNNNPVSNGNVMIYFNNVLFNTQASKDGTFSMTFVDCSSLPQAVDIMGVDKSSKQQGASITIPITGQNVDAGNITACGTSSVAYLNYTLDGTSYSLSDADSLVAFSNPGSGTSFTTYIKTGFSSRPIAFTFSGDASPGTYPIDALTVGDYVRIGVINPFNTTITLYPQNRGEFYDGNFSGNFKDSADLAVIHTISCKFHVRKNY